MLPSSAPLHEALGLGGFNFDNTRRSARHRVQETALDLPAVVLTAGALTFAGTRSWVRRASLRRG